MRSIDAQGNVEQGPAAHAFTIDTVAPDTTIASGPTGPIRDDTPTFGWDSATDVDFECRVDDAPFAPCASPKTTATLSDGEHTFDLRAVDTAGNADPTPDRRVFTVDTAEPETTITGGPEGPTADATPTFTFTSSEPGGTFQCLVGVSFEPCTSPYTYAALEDGSNSFQVRAVDAAGNLDESPAIRSFFVDTFPPDTTITSGPTGTITDETPTFTFGATQPGATFECRVDGAPFVGCTSPHTTAALADGDHTFQVRATDPVGNADPSPASRTFTVDLDTTAPNTWIDSGPSDPTTQVNPTFTFSADEPASFECKIDTGSYAPCEPGGSFGPLADGSHTFSVRATDLAGNVDPSPASRTWTVDTTPPQTTILSGPTLLSLSRRATFDFASSEAGSTFQCRLDGDAWQLCTNPRTYTGVVLGRHTFEVRATDRAGNTDATAAEKTWTTLGLLPF